MQICILKKIFIGICERIAALFLSGYSMDSRKFYLGIIHDHYVGSNFVVCCQTQTNPWIGENGIILFGVIVGENAVVVAGAVVNNDVPDHTIVGGFPAKIIKTIL